VGFQPATKAKLKDGQQVGYVATVKQAQIKIHYFHNVVDVAEMIPDSEEGTSPAQLKEALLEGGYVLGEREWDIEFGATKGRTTYIHPFHSDTADRGSHWR